MQARALLTHGDTARDNYYGATTLASLHESVDVRLSPGASAIRTRCAFVRAGGASAGHGHAAHGGAHARRGGTQSRETVAQLAELLVGRLPAGALNPQQALRLHVLLFSCPPEVPA